MGRNGETTMPRIDAEQMPDGRFSLVWDWDGSEDDLRSFLREAAELGSKASYAVAIEKNEAEKYWYGGTVRGTKGITLLNMRREIQGLQEQSIEFLDQNNYLGSADNYTFEGVGLSAQIW